MVKEKLGDKSERERESQRSERGEMEQEGKGARPGRAPTATATGGDGPLDGLILFGRRAPEGVCSVCIEAELTLTLPFIKSCRLFV